MTPSLLLLFYYLWIAPRVLQVVILIFLVRRGLYTKFPIFTAYTAFGIFEFIALFVISRFSSSTTYFQWYSLGLGISTALRFGIICEIFASVFANHVSLHNIRRPLFRWTTIAFLAIAFSFAVYTHRLDHDPTWFTVHVLARSANIVNCGLILALFLYSSYLRLYWGRVAYGIALGLGVLCSLELPISAVRSQIGHSAHVAIDLLDMAAYHCCVLIWLFYLLTPERRPQSIPDNVPDNDLEAWNHELESLLTR